MPSFLYCQNPVQHPCLLFYTAKILFNIPAFLFILPKSCSTFSASSNMGCKCRLAERTVFLPYSVGFLLGAHTLGGTGGVLQWEQHTRGLPDNCISRKQAHCSRWRRIQRENMPSSRHRLILLPWAGICRIFAGSTGFFPLSGPLLPDKKRLQSRNSVPLMW